MSKQFPSNCIPGTLKGIIIGATAKNLCSQKTPAQVIGHSSHGIFLRLSNDWIIYLSEENWPGPLTLILKDSLGMLQIIEKGEQARIYPGNIEFLERSQVIDTTPARVWQALPPTSNALPWVEIKSRLVVLIQQLRDRKPNRHLEQLLCWFQQGKMKIHIDEALEDGYLMPLLSAAKQSSPNKVIKVCEALLGKGSGLTPAGDDIVIGLLLACQRWGSVLLPMMDLRNVLKEVPQSARLKTTTLSANLIECASQGQADLRLISALDGLITGQPDLDICANYLADWGSSSGVEVLCGIGAALATSDQVEGLSA